MSKSRERFAKVLPLPQADSEAASCEVLISGSGPVGLYLGCALRSMGIDVVIVDPHLHCGVASKANLTSARSLEVLELIGATDAIMQKGRVISGFKLGLNKTWRGSLEGIGRRDISRYAGVFISQGKVEAELERIYLEMGGKLFRAARVIEAKEVGNQVEIEVIRSVYVRPPQVAPRVPKELAEVPKTLFKAKYIVGCDGKQSRVRDLFNFQYLGKEYTQIFLLADVEMKHEEVQAKGLDVQDGCMVLSDDKLLLFMHLAGEHWRVIMASRDLGEEHATLEFLVKTWRDMMPAPGIPDPKILDGPYLFNVSCRIVDTYRKGRCFLAGDAAHCHSPAGGQGMNTGIQDSANLAWRLAAALRSVSPEEGLLSAYSEERRPVAEWVLNSSDKMFRVMSNPSRLFIAARTTLFRTVLPLLPSDSMPPQNFKNRLFGTLHTYRDCDTCCTTGAKARSGGLLAGDRFPDKPCWLSDGTSTTTMQLLSPFRLCLRILFIGPAPPNVQQLERLASKVTSSCKWEVELWIMSSSVDMGLPDRAQELTIRILQGGCDFRTAAGLRADDQAQLVVRPDGYVAIINRGPPNIDELVETMALCSLVQSNGNGKSNGNSNGNGNGNADAPAHGQENKKAKKKTAKPTSTFGKVGMFLCRCCQG
mmetsp:Transcript_57144/g.121475  ORF Transcript_57144/g.121475 Transcript_57144/m.121475 type:complete len:649 (+) Transcript_57144:245-2191(+)